MWNWLVSALASGATLLLYDGSPFHPDGNVLFDFADETGMTLFGTSAKFIDAVAQGRARARRDTHRLDDRADDDVDRLAAGARELRLRLRARQARRAPRLDLRRHRHRQLLRRRQSRSRPVWRGEIQAAGSAWRSRSSTTTASPVRGEKGELVCTTPFPVDAGRLLERSRRPQVPRRLLRALSRRLVPRRLRRAAPSTAA